MKGIDVSSHNGTIDWEKVKADGIQFAIIRIGHGSNIEAQDDRQAHRNMNECERLGIPYGVYIYSYALTEEEAISEADHVRRMIAGRNLKMGIWFDLEDADQYKIKHGVPLDNAHSKLYTDICNTFYLALVTEGYNNIGLYASKSVLDTIIGKDFLKYSGIRVWVAQWNAKCTYKGEYDMWQYSSEGKVNGSSSRTDMNIYQKAICENNAEPKKPTQMKEQYKIGDHIVFSTCYLCSTDSIDKHIKADKMIRNHGIITKIIQGRNNPYLLDGGLCWVNDGDIRGFYK